MRKNLLFLAVSALMLFSCSAIKEAITVPVNTTLSVDVPLTVVVSKSGSLTDKAGTVNNFSTDKLLKVADNIDMTSYINKIKSVDLTKVTITLTPLTGSDEILTLDVAVTGVTGPVFSKTGITASANSFSPVITSSIQSQLDKVETVLKDTRQITLTVSGTTNLPVGTTLNAKLAFDAEFTCMPLN